MDYALIDETQQRRTRARFRARNVYRKRFLDFGFGTPASCAARHKNTPDDACNLTRGVYQRLTLLAGDVFFDEIGVLQAGEFNGESVLDVADPTSSSVRRAD